MKISDLAKFLKKTMGHKEDNRSNDEIIASNYYECIKHLYKGKEKPIVYGYRDEVNEWLRTSVGSIEIDEVGKGTSLYNKVLEINVLIGENAYSEEYVISLINDYINHNW